ncbi:MAG: DUF6152 family protein [Caulobacteraceae bacterium]
MTRLRASTALLALALLAGASGSASAHHAFSMYDMTKFTKVTGTVKSYLWANPHTMVDIEVAGADGKPMVWTAECSPTNMLRGKGWNATSLKVGDKVDFVLHPNRTGIAYGLLVTATKADGVVLKDKD